MKLYFFDGKAFIQVFIMLFLTLVFAFIQVSYHLSNLDLNMDKLDKWGG